MVFLCVHTHMFGFWKWIYSNRTALHHASLSKYSLPAFIRKGLLPESLANWEILVPVFKILRRTACFSLWGTAFPTSLQVSDDINGGASIKCWLSIILPLNILKLLLFSSYYGWVVKFSWSQDYKSIYIHTRQFFEIGSQNVGSDEGAPLKRQRGAVL